MKIFNLFMRRFLTIKLNDSVINKSKKHDLIHVESSIILPEVLTEEIDGWESFKLELRVKND